MAACKVLRKRKPGYPTNINNVLSSDDIKIKQFESILCVIIIVKGTTRSEQSGIEGH